MAWRYLELELRPKVPLPLRTLLSLAVTPDQMLSICTQVSEVQRKLDVFPIPKDPCRGSVQDSRSLLLEAASTQDHMKTSS